VARDRKRLSTDSLLGCGVISSESKHLAASDRSRSAPAEGGRPEHRTRSTPFAESVQPPATGVSVAHRASEKSADSPPATIWKNANCCLPPTGDALGTVPSKLRLVGLANGCRTSVDDAQVNLPGLAH
jgi:hypothetical protein